MKIPLLFAAISSLLSFANAQDTISVKFNTDSVSSGTLDLEEYNAIDETSAPNVATFTISDIDGPDIIVSLNATGSKINLLSGGLVDGSGGFDSSDEGFTLSFSRSVTLVSFDWGSFSSSDGGVLSFTKDGVDPIQVNESDPSWGSTQTDVQNIGLFLEPTDSVTLSYEQGSFLLQGFTIETAAISLDPSIPESSFYSSALGLVALVVLIIKKKCII